MEILTEKQKKSQLSKQADEMRARLWGRLMPPEKRDYIEKIRAQKEKVQATLQEMDLDLNEEAASKVQEKVTIRRLQDVIHPWHPLGVSEETCLHYFVSRTAAEYCVLHKIFHQIQLSNPEFTPSTLFDFGSGVGSGYWAAKEVWQNSLKEIYNVDTNVNMNELASKILQMTNTSFSPKDGVYFRQFLPVSSDRTYDITLSSFTLLELPSFKDRMEAVSTLWAKTENYLVIVEDGTNAGYQAVIEARNLITHMESNKSSKGVGAHVVAPCMHELVCPRFVHDLTPCNFEVSYLPPRFLNNKQDRMKHLYSYIVLKKGPRPKDDSQWPRCVRETLIRNKHIHLRLCTAEGTLENVLIQKAYNCSNAYKCAKHTKWGDCLPGKVIEYEQEIAQQKKKGQT
ncbi:methyltransferase-like protein 17, mitochondrial isoform X2 [Thrips palmi]|nr:methyltransferase-like protein 17, mitochondrial isoform X2 [Thrips palmi]